MSRPEIEVADLNEFELLALHALLSMRPDATLQEKLELQKLSIGLTNAQLNAKLATGFECLKGRGAVVPVKNDDGTPQLDTDGKQVFQCIGKFITRVREVDATKFL